MLVFPKRRDRDPTCWRGTFADDQESGAHNQVKAYVPRGGLRSATPVWAREDLAQQPSTNWTRFAVVTPRIARRTAPVVVAPQQEMHYDSMRPDT
jgi:hypothetical protein